jgi:hypothetical protein
MTTKTPLTPLERIFERMAATYGAVWDRSLGVAPIADVMTAWGHELSGFFQNRRSMMAIAWALENLPERCPNVIEFKNLCRCAPAVELPALPEPKADPALVAMELERLAPLLQPVPVSDCKAWARRLRDAHLAGHSLNQNQVRCYRLALGMAESE